MNILKRLSGFLGRRATPRLVMTLLVRDEDDIVRQNIEHHLNHGVDFIVATDNASEDGTADILREYERMGVLELRHEPSRNFDQEIWVRDMALRARDKHGADWILNNDADEFWYSPKGNLKHEIEHLREGVLICPRLNLFAAHDADTSAPWEERLIYGAARPIEPPPPAKRRSGDMEYPFYYYRLMPKALASAPGLVSVDMGNHDVTHDREIPRCGHDILIYHFPTRSAESLERKVTHGGAALEINTGIPQGKAQHWRQWYATLKQGGSMANILDYSLPDTARLKRDLEAGILTEHTTMRDRLASLAARR